MKASAAESEEMTMAVSMLNTDVTWIEKRALVRFWKCKEEIYTEMKKKMHYQECVVIGLLALSSDTGGFRENKAKIVRPKEWEGFMAAQLRDKGKEHFAEFLEQVEAAYEYRANLVANDGTITHRTHESL